MRLRSRFDTPRNFRAGSLTFRAFWQALALRSADCASLAALLAPGFRLGREGSLNDAEPRALPLALYVRINRATTLMDFRIPDIGADLDLAGALAPRGTNRAGRRCGPELNAASSCAAFDGFHRRPVGLVWAKNRETVVLRNSVAHVLKDGRGVLDLAPSQLLQPLDQSRPSGARR